jgi:hypothetical protein
MAHPPTAFVALATPIDNLKKTAPLENLQPLARHVACNQKSSHEDAKNAKKNHQGTKNTNRGKSEKRLLIF